MRCPHIPERRTSLRTLTAWALAALCLAAAPAAEPQVRVERARYLMGTICRGTVYHEDRDQAARSLAEAFDAIADLEAVLSAWREGSEISRLNGAASTGPVAVSESLFDFLGRALQLAEETGGAFDPTLGALVEAWDLRGEGRIPAREELADALRATGYTNLRLDASRGTAEYLRHGLQVDSGAVGKGYALDTAEAVLRSNGVEAALLDFGGQLLAIGSPPGEEAWEVAVADPSQRHRPFTRVGLRDASLATSGQSERGFEIDGRRFGHVLDPARGWPVEASGSVTVLAPTAAEADAYSTALLVMGRRRGETWLEGRPWIRAAWLGEEAGGGEGRHGSPDSEIHAPGGGEARLATVPPNRRGQGK